MYPDIADDAVDSAVNQKYLNFELKATVGKQHLTVETNLRNDYLAQRAAIFKNNSYNTRLIFMMLPSLKASMDRVNLRVKQKGHFVDAESVRYNLKKSLENYLRLAPQFDQVMLTCAPTAYGIRARPGLLLSIQSGVIAQFNDFIPEWAIPQSKRRSAVLSTIFPATHTGLANNNLFL